MPLKPSITVYIASHNYGEFVEDAIKSVLKQTSSDWELFLINDGSSDNTKKIFESYKNNSKIRIFHTNGIGLPAVNNLAIKNAKGKYLIRLDGDDIFDENILLILGQYLDNDKNLALVFPDFYFVDQSGKIFAREWIRKLYDHDKILDEPPNGACTMIRLDILKKIGGYREDLGAQDGLDIWLKIKDDYKSTNVNLPLFYYRRHSNNLTDKPIKIVNARRTIKLDSAHEKLKDIKPKIAVIPCRKKYDFVDDLWSQKLREKSLLEHDLNVCISSNYFDHIIVACDNKNSIKVVNKFKKDGRVEFFLRDSSSTSISVSIVDTLKKIIDIYDPNKLGLLLMRYIQTPFVSKGTLEEAMNTLALSETESAFAVEQIRDDVFDRKSNGLVPFGSSKYNTLDTPNLYRDSSTCLAAKCLSIYNGNLRGEKSVGFPVSAAESFFIRSVHDLKVANQLDY